MHVYLGAIFKIGALLLLQGSFPRAGLMHVRGFCDQGNLDQHPLFIQFPRGCPTWSLVN